MSHPSLIIHSKKIKMIFKWNIIKLKEQKYSNVATFDKVIEAVFINWREYLRLESDVKKNLREISPT